MGDEALRLSGVGLRTAEGKDILRDVAWSLETGDCGVIIGPSGSGKSRLLRLLNRLDDPTAGEIHVSGRPVPDWEVGELRRRVALVPQRPALSGSTPRETLETPGRLGLLTPAAYQERLPAALRIAQVPGDLLDTEISRLSGGERQRVAIARALLLEPFILCLDEPTGALDGPTATDLLTAIQAWRHDNGRTLIVVTHRVNDARALGGQLAVLMDGHVEESGPVADVLERPRSPRVAAFIQGAA